jgi:protein tyrosine/serine phosphatase
MIGLSMEAGRVFAGSNEHTVIPGKVYRSAQLSQQKLTRVIVQKNIRTVVNLRGCCPQMNWYMNDAWATHMAGISQEDLTLSAKRFPPPNELNRLVEIFDHTEYPILIHCAAGADRTGLASSMALLLLTDATLSVARQQMWPRYGHLAIGRTAVLDQFFDYYQSWLDQQGQAHSPERFRHWLLNNYCPGPFRAELSVIEPKPLIATANRGFVVQIRATNRSIEPWELVPGGSGGVKLRYTVFSKAGECVYRGHTGHQAHRVMPGHSIDLIAGFPPIPNPGLYMLHADLLDCQSIDLLDTNFAQYGSEPLIAELSLR